MNDAALAVTYDPFSFSIHDDPFPVYQVLRDEQPVYWNDKWRFWALSRYGDVQAAARDWETFSTKAGVDLDDFTALYGPGMFLNADPPYHDHMRGILREYFTPKAVNALEDMVRTTASGLADRMADAGNGDLAREFTSPLPTALTMQMLGFPPDDLSMLQGWQAALIMREPDTDQLPEAAWEAGRNLRRYFTEMVADRRKRTQTGLIDVIAAGEADGRRLSPQEIEGMALFIWMAGNETTASLMSNSLMHLARFPDQRADLVENLSLLPQAIEELLRYDAPLQNMGRVTTRDVEVEGVLLPADSRVLLLYGSANRDERRWKNADTLDIRREPQRHLAFGEGIHHCLGAHLARLESRVAFEILLPLIPDYSIVGEVQRTHVHTTRGVTSLPAAW